MSRVVLLHLFVLSFAVAVPVLAQQSPLTFANVVVEHCGRVGKLLSEGSGTGQRNGQTTRYATAAFEIACDDDRIGQLDIQTADNDPTVVTYRVVKGQAESESISGTDTGALVEQGIRGACSCGLR